MTTSPFLRKNTRHGFTAILALLGMSALHTASADNIIYQSATDDYTGLSATVENGSVIGAVFTLSQATSVTGLGAQFADSA